MARINVWDQQYQRPEAPPVSRTLTAPGCPALPLTLRRLGALEAAVAADKAREYAATYVEGTGDQPPMALLFPGGKRVPLSELMLQNVATLEQMQVADEGDEPYQLIEWLGIADRFPALWGQVIRFSNEVQNPPGDPGNVATPATGE